MWGPIPPASDEKNHSLEVPSGKLTWLAGEWAF